LLDLCCLVDLLSFSRLQRTVLAAVLLLAIVAAALAAPGVDTRKKVKKGPKVTIKVFFDITIGGKDVGEDPNASEEQQDVRHPRDSPRSIASPPVSRTYQSWPLWQEHPQDRRELPRSGHRREGLW
jgi:hypothetical protein